MIGIFPGRFLCGCDPNSERIKNYTTSIDPVTGNLTSKRYDAQGDEVCPIHGKRLYGHASITAHGPQGNDVTDYYKMYLQLYGREKNKGKLGSPTIEDRRDNRDPSKIGSGFLSRKNGKGNGKNVLSR